MTVSSLGFFFNLTYSTLGIEDIADKEMPVSAGKKTEQNQTINGCSL